MKPSLPIKNATGVANIAVTARVASGGGNPAGNGGGKLMDDVQAVRAPIHLWIVGLGYQILLAPPPPPPMDTGAMAAMPWVIIIVAALFYYYAHRQQKAGVLR